MIFCHFHPHFHFPSRIIFITYHFHHHFHFSSLRFPSSFHFQSHLSFPLSLFIPYLSILTFTFHHTYHFHYHFHFSYLIFPSPFSLIFPSPFSLSHHLLFPLSLSLVITTCKALLFSLFIIYHPSKPKWKHFFTNLFTFEYVLDSFLLFRPFFQISLKFCKTYK